jgi:hypothetical protein
MKSIVLNALLVLPLLQAGCIGQIEADEGVAADLANVDVLRPAGVPTDNGNVVTNLVNAPLFTDSTIRSVLLGRQLATSSLDSAVRDSVCGHAESRTQMKFIVQCALGPSSTVAIDCDSSRDFLVQGKIGLATEWETGSCTTAACQEWVSACVIAHSNALGSAVQIKLNAAPLPDSSSDASFQKPEGAYFGNVFRNNGGQQIYGCYMGSSPARMARVCGTSASSLTPLCDVFSAPLNTPIRRCGDVCSAWNNGGTPAVSYDDFFTGCAVGSSAYAARVVTVFRQ